MAPHVGLNLGLKMCRLQRHLGAVWIIDRSLCRRRRSKVNRSLLPHKLTRVSAPSGLWAYLHPMPGMEIPTLVLGTVAAAGMGLVVTSQDSRRPADQLHRSSEVQIRTGRRR